MCYLWHTLAGILYRSGDVGTLTWRKSKRFLVAAGHMGSECAKDFSCYRRNHLLRTDFTFGNNRLRIPEG